MRSSQRHQGRTQAQACTGSLPQCSSRLACRSLAPRVCHSLSQSLQARRVCCASSSDDGPGASATAERPDGPQKAKDQDASPRIQRTMGSLDALLGIPDQPEPVASTSSSSSSTPKAADASKSADPLIKLADEAQRLSGGDAGKAGPLKDDMEIQFAKIVEKARKLADDQAKAGGGNTQAGQDQLRQEFETLLQKINTTSSALDKEDVKKLKEAAFGPQTFFVTESQPITDSERTGLLIRGNLRDERSRVFAHVQMKVTELFKDKYTVLMVEDEQATRDDGPAQMGTESGARASGAAAKAAEYNTPRVAFQIVPSAQALPPETTNWKQAVAVILALLFIASCGQLALAANVTKLPKETLEWFANPANFESSELPPGLESWDPTPYFTTAIPIFSAVLGVNIAHEAGHRIAAAIKDVKLGPTLFVPNLQIGSFGAITPFTSMLKDRATLWDVAAAGPLAGVLISTTFLAVGLFLSHSGQVAGDGLVAVPTQLFQGSLLLGSIVRVALGEGALRGTEVLVSPLVIAGWCGLITQALQLLPVGSVDGGRMVQAAFGRNSLALSSFFTYVGLGLGLLGSSLALPYGLYVIICQRTAEKFIQDSVTPAGDARATATAVALLVAILVLVPMAPELAQEFGVGSVTGGDNFF